MQRDELVRFLDSMLLDDCPCQDSSNNGLQVEGTDEVSRVAFAVDGCLEVFQKAAEEDVDFLMVHHGISWGPGLRRFTGSTADRLRALFCNGISLYAAHLPLDAHAEVGNNAVIARKLDLVDILPFAEYGGIQIGHYGMLDTPLCLGDFATFVEERLDTSCTVVDAGTDTVRRVGVVSGGGADEIPEAASLGLDCLLTGEIVHQHIHTARECGINVIAAGHYRTEVWGVQAVMGWLKQTRPELECSFLDVPTGF